MPQVTDTGKKRISLPQFRSDVLIALGANLASTYGDAAESLRKAVTLIPQGGEVIRLASPLYRTPAFPAGNGPDYVNAAVLLQTDRNASTLLSDLHAIEAMMGRERVQRWGQRSLDLDILGIGDMILPDLQTYRNWAQLPLEQQMRVTPDQLILPHPRLHERAFVLVPLADVAPDWVHPVLRLSVRQMLDALPDEAKREVVRLE